MATYQNHLTTITASTPALSMAANALDCIMLFGDSLTQGGWEPG
jgi:hypothetical protein